MPQTDRWKQQLGLVWNVPQCVCWYLRVCVCACIWNGNAPWRLPAVSEGLLCQGGAPLTAVFMGRFLQESSQFRRQWFHMRLKRAFSQRPGFEYLFTTSTHTHTHTKGVADVHVCVCVCVCVCACLRKWVDASSSHLTVGRQAAKQPHSCPFTCCAGLCYSSSSFSLPLSPAPPCLPCPPHPLSSLQLL